MDAVRISYKIHAAMANYLTLSAWRIYFSGNFHDVPENITLPDNSHPPADLDVPMLPALPVPQGACVAALRGFHLLVRASR